VQIAKLRTIAIAKGEVPPEFFKIVPLKTPSYFKAPGRKARKCSEQSDPK
jgi:hypothetical protein